MKRLSRRHGDSTPCAFDKSRRALLVGAKSVTLVLGSAAALASAVSLAMSAARVVVALAP